MMASQGCQLGSLLPIPPSRRRHLKRLPQLERRAERFVANAVGWIPPMRCVFVAVQVTPYHDLVAALRKREKPATWNAGARRRLILRETGHVHENSAPAPLDMRFAAVRVVWHCMRVPPQPHVYAARRGGQH